MMTTAGLFDKARCSISKGAADGPRAWRSPSSPDARKVGHQPACSQAVRNGITKLLLSQGRAVGDFSRGALRANAPWPVRSVVPGYARRVCACTRASPVTLAGPV